MQLEQIIQEWCFIAGQDMASANYLNTMKPKPMEVIGFLCQQAVEKYMKAFLVQNGTDPDKTHDLFFLLKQCQSFDSTFIDLFETANNLNQYAVQTRYPYPHQLQEEQINQSLELANKAVGFLCSKLGI